MRLIQTTELLNVWLKLKGERNSTPIRTGDFNTPLEIDRTTGQEINKAVEGFNNTISPQDPIDIYRISPHKAQ